MCKKSTSFVKIQVSLFDYSLSIVSILFSSLTDINLSDILSYSLLLLIIFFTSTLEVFASSYIKNYLVVLY